MVKMMMFGRDEMYVEEFARVAFVYHAKAVLMAGPRVCWQVSPWASSVGGRYEHVILWTTPMP